MHHRIKKSWQIIAAIIAIIISCTIISHTAGAQKKLTQQDIDEHGTKIFTGSKDSVTEALRQALLTRGYAIEVEMPSKGLIRTNRRDIGATSVASYSEYSGSAVSRRNYRQYSATITDVGSRQVKVVLTPIVYIGDANVSERKIWVLKGVAGEYKLWETLFADMQERL